MRYLSVLLVSVGVCIAGSADADIVVNFTQSGGDVISTASGTVDVAWLIFNPLGVNGSGSARVDPSGFSFLVGPSVATPHGVFFASGAALTGPASFGLGGLTNADAGSGDRFGLIEFDPSLILALPTDYVSGASIESESIYFGSSLLSLGIEPGTYSWSAGSNTITLNAVVVPEPSSSALIVGCLAAAGIRRRCRLE